MLFDAQLSPGNHSAFTAREGKNWVQAVSTHPKRDSKADATPDVFCWGSHQNARNGLDQVRHADPHPCLVCAIIQHMPAPRVRCMLDEVDAVRSVQEAVGRWKLQLQRERNGGNTRPDRNPPTVREAQHHELVQLRRIPGTWHRNMLQSKVLFYQALTLLRGGLAALGHHAPLTRFKGPPLPAATSEKGIRLREAVASLQHWQQGTNARLALMAIYSWRANQKHPPLVAGHETVEQERSHRNPIASNPPDEQRCGARLRYILWRQIMAWHRPMEMALRQWVVRVVLYREEHWARLHWNQRLCKPNPDL